MRNRKVVGDYDVGNFHRFLAELEGFLEEHLGKSSYYSAKYTIKMTRSLASTSELLAAYDTQIFLSDGVEYGDDIKDVAIFNAEIKLFKERLIPIIYGMEKAGYFENRNKYYKGE